MATSTMLERAVTDKVGALPNWNGNFARRWLLLFNHYPLVSDVSEVETVIGTLLRKNPDWRGLDGIFWHGGVGSSLVAIPASVPCAMFSYGRRVVAPTGAHVFAERGTR